MYGMGAPSGAGSGGRAGSGAGSFITRTGLLFQPIANAQDLSGAQLIGGPGAGTYGAFPGVVTTTNDPAQLPPVSNDHTTPIPVAISSSGTTTTTATTDAPTTDWTSIFTEASFFGLPNWILMIAGVGVVAVMSGKKKR